MTKYYQAYICPKCRESLLLQENTLVCKNNHCFDIAKEGYINLLLANQKNSLNPGDNKDMILARDQFLEAGYYNFLVENILMLSPLNNRSFQNILEIGCGSGFYLNWLKNSLRPTAIIGSDISKEAIKFAAKKYQLIDYAVTSSFDLSFRDSFFNLIISIFSPFINSEIERVITKPGIFILVRPGKNHLAELYELLGIPRKTKTYPHFTKLKLIESKEISEKTSISKEGLTLLIKMSPLFWKTQHFDFEHAYLPEIIFNFFINVYENN